MANDRSLDDVRTLPQELLFYPPDVAGQQPKFIDVERMKQHVTFSVGSTERLLCTSSGNPRPHVTWFKDGVRLTSDSAAEVVDFGSVAAATQAEQQLQQQQQQLLLDDVKKSDGGVYQCVVANEYGSISFTFYVAVMGLY